MKSKFAEKLSRYREKANVSQSELARRVESSASLISRLESGDRQPSDRTVVYALGKALDLPLEERNELLVSAGYAPITIGASSPSVPDSVRLLFDIMDSSRVPEEEKNLLSQQLRQIRRRYINPDNGEEADT